MMREIVVTHILLPVVAGFFLDLLLGDPHVLYHPVRLVGKLITAVEGILRRLFPATKAGEKRAGICLVLVTAGVTTGAAYLACMMADHISPRFGLAFRAALCYWLLAVRSLRDESMKVCRALEAGEITQARSAVAMIVGRDTDRLTPEGVAKAAVETVAENTSDGIIAPLFYMVLGGPVLGWLYKSINTMDSMVGYKNDRYRYFGCAAARLDDIAGFLPARLSALLMILSCVPARLQAKEAWRIFRRDRYNHASPNSAQTEAVMAGALGVQLAGDAWYFGELHKKKTIGDETRKVVAGDIRLANRLLYLTATLGLILLVLLRLAFTA